MAGKPRLFVHAGQVFNRLTVIDPETRNARGERAALCRCDCGRQTFAVISDLVRGERKSCGNHPGDHMKRLAQTPEGKAHLAKMLNSPTRIPRLQIASAASSRRAKLVAGWDDERRKTHGDRFVTHGLTKHPLYQMWKGMMHRCHDENDQHYADWGGRGIKVCDEWHDVRNFIAWAETNLGPKPKGMSIDRWPDNNGNYRPGNVRWATWSQQARNTRRAIKAAERKPAVMRLRAAGLTYPQIAAELGITPKQAEWAINGRRRNRAPAPGITAVTMDPLFDWPAGA